MRVHDRRQRPRQHRFGLMGAHSVASLRPAFVDVVPDAHLMEPDVLYVSMAYATAIHKCACGCGREAVTPLAPDEWSLTYNGDTISLSPSIGNWGMECRSHYWVQANDIIWASDETRLGLLTLLRRVWDSCRLLLRPRKA